MIGVMAQTKTKKSRTRTYARNRAQAAVQYRPRFVEADSTYFLKLICVVLLGTLWIKLSSPVSWHGMPFGGLPLGTCLGLIAIKLFEKDPFDRRIWYAVLIVVTIVSYFVPAGIII